jgi:hypothetical protein
MSIFWHAPISYLGPSTGYKGNLKANWTRFSKDRFRCKAEVRSDDLEYSNGQKAVTTDCNSTTAFNLYHLLFHAVFNSGGEHFVLG